MVTAGEANGITDCGMDVMDHYLWAFLSEIQSWVSHREAQTIDRLVEMVEHYMVVEDIQDLSRLEKLCQCRKQIYRLTQGLTFRRVRKQLPQCPRVLLWHKRTRVLLTG